MKNRLATAAVTAALLSAASIPAARAQSSSELQALKAQLEELQKKVSELEAQQKAQTETSDKTLDQTAQLRSQVGDWVGRWQWKADVRYRNEGIEQEFSPTKRNRDRLRVRAGVVARVNDTVRAEVQLSTAESLTSGGNGDARSPNQTLGDSSSRKSVWFDTAFVEWSPVANVKATLGKMRYPWVRPASVLFFDSDINPEGLALNWQQGTGGLFASAFYMNLAERSSMADSTLSGAQLGWRGKVAGDTQLTLAAGYFDHGAVEGYSAVQDARLPANAYGNSTTADPSVCRAGILNSTTTACIANDFNIVQGVAELTTPVGGKPLTFVADYSKNLSADFASATNPGGLDTAYALGVQYGRVTGANTWEVGYLYQEMENDALYAQWIDSDFGGGATGSRGHVFRLGYGFGRNFRFNGTYFWNETNIDLPATVGGVPVLDRGYKRFQLDVLATF